MKCIFLMLRIGDHPRPLPVIKELKEATDVTDRKGSPSWDYDEEKASWLWKIPPPGSKKQTDTGGMEAGKIPRTVRRKTQMMSVSERLLKEFCCLICHKVMNLPLTTPCAHNFCKSCLEGAFAGQTFIKERTCEGRRTLRAQKNVMKCPSCTNDISEYLQNPQVNRELMSVIESLQRETKEAEENACSSEENEKCDVMEEDKDKEVKDMNAEVENSKADVKEAGDVDKVVSDDSVDETVEDNDKKDAIEKASPKPKANKKRKAGVIDDMADAKEAGDVDKVVSDDSVDETVQEKDKKEAIEKASPKAKAKAIKKRKAGVTDDTADQKVDEVENGGKQTPKKKKGVDAKCASPASPAANTRSKKA